MTRKCLLGVVLLVACGPAATTPPEAPKPTGIALPTPSRNIHLRATFDDDPTTYVGRFVPANTAAPDLDENAAATTRCSKFFKTKVVNVNQTMDEVMYASKQATASLGIIPFGGVVGGAGSATTLRVKYTITKKVQVTPDAEGLDACCKADEKQCSAEIIGEFYFGTGEVLQAVDQQKSIGGTGAYEQVRGGADYKEGLNWKKVSQFKDMYFAFQTTKTPLGLGGVEATADDCSWCEKLPGSLDGQYFCGVSPDAPSEAMARDLAMRNAREQAVKFLGEYVVSRSKTEASLIKGYVEDVQYVAATADGMASRVKDQKWCKAQPVNAPDGQKYRSRVLAFFPNSQTQGAAQDLVETLIMKRRAQGAITPAQEKSLREMVK